MSKNWKSCEIQFVINLYYARVTMAKIAAVFQVTEQSIGKLLKRHLPCAQINSGVVLAPSKKASKKNMDYVMSIKDAFYWLRNQGFPIKTRNFVSFLTPYAPVELTKEQFVLIFNRERLSKGFPIAYVREVTDGGF